MLCVCVGIKSTCINAATLAFIDAGIPMKDYVCACSASFIEEQPIIGNVNFIYKYINNYCLLDINHAEELCNGPDLTIATLPKSNKIVFLQVIIFS